MLRKDLRKISKKIYDNFTDVSFEQGLSLYLAEIYSRSSQIEKHIADIRKMANKELDESNVDELLTHLTKLRIEIYDEMADWMSSLRKPLKVAITETSKKLAKFRRKKER